MKDIFVSKDFFLHILTFTSSFLIETFEEKKKKHYPRHPQTLFPRKSEFNSEIANFNKWLSLRVINISLNF